MKLYHCSPSPGIKILEPSVTHYFGKPRQVCLTAKVPMAFFYGIRHFEYTYGYTRDGRLYYEEYFPGALEGLYGGKTASLYTCSHRADMAATPIPNEYVSSLPVAVEDETVIPDLYAALLEQEALGAVKLVRWPEVSPERRAWILDAETKTILEKGLLDQPDSPFGQYMRETYPESWALAQKTTQEAQP